jgi:glycerophosphoryl diester phosphodiesterase
MALRCSLLAAVVTVLVLPGAASAQNPWILGEGKVLNMAHQGGELEAPSDTLYALKTSIDKGADMLELDVHLSADGQIVVLHDGTVDATTNGTGSVEDMTVEQIKTLDAAHWFVPGARTPHDRPAADYVLRGIATGAVAPPEGFTANDFTIPTLEEVLQAFPDTPINIELKPTQRQTGAIEQAAADLLARYERTDDVIVVSFTDNSTLLFKALAPAVHTATGTAQAALFWASHNGPLPGLANPLNVALQVPMALGVPVMSQDFVDNAHANGLAVHVWTIDDEATMRQLVEWGVDGIMTDAPTLLERVLQETGAAV